jgi:hypothetical protein
MSFMFMVCAGSNCAPAVASTSASAAAAVPIDPA